MEYYVFTIFLETFLQKVEQMGPFLLGSRDRLWRYSLNTNQYELPVIHWVFLRRATDLDLSISSNLGLKKVVGTEMKGRI